MGLRCLNTRRVSDSQAESAAHRCLLSRGGGEVDFQTVSAKAFMTSIRASVEAGTAARLRVF